MNWPNANEIVTLLTSLATLLTAIAALLTIREMQRQRTSAYLPDFAFGFSRVYWYWRPTQPGFGVEWSDTPLDTSQANSTADPPLKNACLKCYNIGLASAKEIAIAWRFDEALFASALNQFGPDTPLTADELRASWVSLNTELGASSHNRANQMRNVVPYLLPATVEAEPYHLKLPTVYLFLYALYLYRLTAQIFDVPQGAASKYPLEPPGLDLEFDFQDIEGNRRQKRYVVTLQVEVLRNMPHEQIVSEFADGYAEVKPGSTRRHKLRGLLSRAR